MCQAQVGRSNSQIQQAVWHWLPEPRGPLFLAPSFRQHEAGPFSETESQRDRGGVGGKVGLVGTDYCLARHGRGP